MDRTNRHLATETTPLFDKFEHFILKKFHPCVMARSVFMDKQIDFHVYDKMGDPETSRILLSDLKLYLEKASGKGRKFFSFIAAFPKTKIKDEDEYERVFWQQLQVLHELDPHDWDPEVSSDPKDPEFSFSLLGTAFYLVGMHPKSSRMARQAPCPAIIFNLHSQFEQLRGMGAYKRVRDKIRKRDKKLQGSINPMLADFGTSSEAKQYSGKAVDENWKCPFTSRVNKIKNLCAKLLNHKRA